MPQKNSHLKRVQPIHHGDFVSVTKSSLEIEYQERQELYEGQSALTLHFIEAQAAQLAEAIIQNLSQARFSLPDRVVIDPKQAELQQPKPIPSDLRDQLIGGVFDRISGSDLRTLIKNKLIELESSENPAVMTAGFLMRHAIAAHMVYRMLPSGRSVSYRVVAGEEIPTLPEESRDEKESAITASTDAIAEAGEGPDGGDRGELQVPYVPYARRFYLPQWVAFDKDGRMLVNSVNEAESTMASMQRYISILHMAVSISPYFVFDPDYRRKRYGMLGQLINQGRAMACYEVREMVESIKKRAAAQSLNRGLSLSLPYFDDQSLEIRLHDFMVIPAGRIMFTPAFVVQAAREEQAKVVQDTRLSPSTRKYLLNELREIEAAFQGSRQSN